MKRDRVLVGAGAAAGLCALMAVVFVGDRGGGGSGTTQKGEPAIEVRTSVSPRNALFGDTVTAVVEVTLDRARVNPDSVQVVNDFSPWAFITKPRVFRRDTKTSTYLRTTYALHCLEASCLSAGQSAVQQFPAALVTYASQTAASGNDRSVVKAAWPELVVGSRYLTTVGQRADSTAYPWRTNLLSLPTVTYRLSPSLLVALLLVAGALLAVAGGTLAYRARPQRAPPAPLVEEAPEPVVTPIERALSLLEDPTRIDGAAEQRRALQLVSEELDEHGDLQLAQAARALAWSKPIPAVETTTGMATRARSALEEDDAEQAEQVAELEREGAREDPA